MKIKEVCEKTGLTDKAVRVYIDNELLYPKYTENYTGRKSFDFSEQDIERLKRIIIYRKAGISLSDIKDVLDNKISLQTAIDKTADKLDNSYDEISISLQINNDIKVGNYTNDNLDVERFFSEAYQPDPLSSYKKKAIKLLRWVIVVLILLCIAVIGNTVIKYLNGELKEVSDIVFQIIFDVVSVGCISFSIYYYKKALKDL